MNAERADLNDLHDPRASLPSQCPGDPHTPYKGCVGVRVSARPMSETAYPLRKSHTPETQAIGQQDAPPRTVERWCITVHRPDGNVEVLPYLFHDQPEASAQSRFHAKEWRGVTVKPAKCNVEVIADEP